ncbi:ribosome biogenesis GTPase Der [Methylococcus geothermalis]|uniref:GTPase Der n=1 Tax=Methylococcus geothermalis TaxID=2681310 RepID=A0A858Q5M6_9GAMM|nr:ribosome biogenesis GTPase Der [Methylococcus geothermalis]QJD29104.1 ribosome biogenesis GTPase Der [Methylococcus geothermalis]
MLPIVALIGRTNVGKSTLFNYLTRTRDALVADYPGLTRDRQYGRVQRGERNYFVVDTGGIIEAAEGIDDQAMKQVDHVLDEADVILFLVDVHAGMTAGDELIAERLHRISKPVLLVANKIDGTHALIAGAEFHAFGLGEPQLISAAHGTGVHTLLERVEALLPEPEPEAETDAESGIRIAVVGRPNVGKSTLVNRILGEERVVVYDQPGTTRDSIYIPFERRGERYTLIDTAGIRRRARVNEGIEKFSVLKSFQAIEKAHVVIYLVDASEGLTDQDANLLGMVLEIGRGLLIGFNKWDGLDPEQRERVKRQIDIKLPFLEFAKKYFVSALHGTGVGVLMDAVKPIYQSAMLDLSASRLTQVLQDCLTAHQPPLVRGRRIKLKYAHQGGHNPPVIVIHGNQTEDLPAAYKRYLGNEFRKAFKLQGVPLKLVFKSAENPFQGRRNELTERQIKKRRRMIRHVKKR